MTLFQASALPKDMKQQNGATPFGGQAPLIKTCTELTPYFHNAQRKASIFKAKEEQFWEVFDRIMGLTYRNSNFHF